MNKNKYLYVKVKIINLRGFIPVFLQLSPSSLLKCLVGCKRLKHSSFRHTTVMLDRCTENQCIALEKTEGAIKNGQSRDTVSIGYEGI
jgi:hypothetical protein